MLMLRNRTREEVLQIAENIRAEIHQMVIPWENSIELRATMTFGVAEYEDKDSVDDNISKADRALYAGKMRGRNQVISYADL